MAITYAAGVITVTGYTAGTPCTFTDIYNADVSGSWGVVTRQCTNQFCFDCTLVIGDASTATHFADTEKTAIFTATASHIRFIQVRTNGNFRIGEVVNAGRRTSWKGCTIIGVTQTDSDHVICNYATETTGKIEIYSSSIIDLGTTAGCSVLNYSGNYYIWNSTFSGINIWMPWSTSSCELYNLYIAKGRNEGTIFYPKTIDVFDRVTVAEAANGVFGSGAGDYGDYTAKNLTGVGCPYVIYFWGAQPKDGYLVNPDIDTWAFNWSTATGKVYRQYEIDLKVIDKDNAAINGATVKIWDKDSNLIVDTTTNASGVIATQTITRGYYNSANGNTLQEASPHLIKIEKAGYTTYEADFTLEERTDWLIALQVGGGGLLRNPPMTGGMV